MTLDEFAARIGRPPMAVRGLEQLSSDEFDHLADAVSRVRERQRSRVDADIDRAVPLLSPRIVRAVFRARGEPHGPG